MKIFTTFYLIVLCSSSLLASRFYLDPTQGDLANSGTMISPWPSLEEVIDAGYIKSQRYSPLPYNSETSDLTVRNPDGIVEAGDTLILMDGLHGSVFLLGYINQMPITVMGMDGHSPVVEYIHLRACKNWRFENIKVSSEPYGYYLHGRLCFVESHSWHGPSSHVEILDCEMYSAEEPWETAEEWSEKVSSGLYIIGDSVTVLNNVFRNIGFGITATGDYIVASRNRIVNFSGDGMRLLGSHQVFSYNLIKNCYDINENHDDGIQSWAQINGIVADDNQLIGNIIINTDDTERPLNGPLQGIGCFDGFYNRWRVENNLVLVDHWHGITFLGANDCQIVNNTVIDLTPDITPGASWIRIADHKNGTPSAGCLVANNVANSFHVDANTSNNVILNTYDQYENNFSDFQNFDFHLISGSELIDAANPDFAPHIDLDENLRPLGELPDVGAYEYFAPSSTLFDPGILQSLKVHPNPARGSVCLSSAPGTYQIEVWDLRGVLLMNKYLQIDSSPMAIDLSDLCPGPYLLYARDRQTGEFAVVKLIVE